MLRLRTGALSTLSNETLNSIDINSGGITAGKHWFNPR